MGLQQAVGAETRCIPRYPSLEKSVVVVADSRFGSNG